jgi:hypothetical protein
MGEAGKSRAFYHDPPNLPTQVAQIVNLRLVRADVNKRKLTICATESLGS